MRQLTRRRTDWKWGGRLGYAAALVAAALAGGLAAALLFGAPTFPQYLPQAPEPEGKTFEFRMPFCPGSHRRILV